LRYILLYKRYISCSVTQGSSYPLMFNLVPLEGTSTPGLEPLLYRVVNELCNKTMQKLISILSKGGLYGISEREEPEATTSFASPNIRT